MVNKPAVVIKNAWLADTNRCGKSRKPGAMSSIRNLFPTISDGVGRIRPGFSDYTTVAETTGMTDCIVVPIQKPEQADIFIQFADADGSSATQEVYVNPYWRGSTKVASNMQINESKSFTGVTGTVSGNVLTIYNAEVATLSSTNDYYNGWIIKNSTQTEYALVKDYSYAYDNVEHGYVATFTTVDILDASPTDATEYNWVVTNAYVLYRNFHSGLTFTPAYNFLRTYPPTGRSDESVVRFSGGASSDTGNMGIIYFPYIKRVFFPADTTYTYTYEGSYIDKRELDGITKDNLFCDSGTKISCVEQSSDSLTLGKTYWVAFAPVYDSYQLGELLTLEDTTNDYTVTGAYWTKNYLQTSGGGKMSFALKMRPHLWNKRITGLAIYLATDDGQQTVRKNQYKFIQYLDFLSDDGQMSTANFDATNNYWEFSADIYIDTNTAVGNTYVTDSGIVEVPTDTMYAYSIEEKIGGKHYLANCYVTSEAAEDNQKIFTNPIGQNAYINAGLVQPDLFSNEEGIYRLEVQPTIGTKITALKSMGMGEVLLLKDRGVLYGRDITNTINITEFLWNVISPYAGCVATNMAVDGDGGYIYFVGYDDIYRFRGNNLETLIERPDKNDWLYTYQNSIVAAQKEQSCTFYLPEINCVYFLFANNGETYTGMQYVFFPSVGEWREVYLGEVAPNRTPLVSFKRANKIQGGNTIVVTNESGTEALRRMTFTAAGAFVYTDNAVTVKPYLDTYYFIPSGNEFEDFVITKVVINKTLASTVTAGTLDCYMYLDSDQYKEYSDLSKTDTHLELYFPLDITKVNGVITAQKGLYTGQQVRLIYNSDNTGEYITSGSSFIIDSIEVYGRVIPRVRANE